MNKSKRALVLLLSFIMLVTCFTTQVFAATSIKCQPSGSTGGGKKTVTFVASKKGTGKVSFTMGKGTLVFSSILPSKSCFGAYEIKVFDSKGKEIKKQNICQEAKDNNKSTVTKTVSFPVAKGQSYKIQIYFWNATTTAKYYADHSLLSLHGYSSAIDAGYWSKMPSLTISNPSNGTLK